MIIELEIFLVYKCPLSGHVIDHCSQNDRTERINWTGGVFHLCDSK